MKTQEKVTTGRFERVITILTPELRRRLEAEAERRTMSRSLLIRQACDQFLKQAEKEAA